MHFWFEALKQDYIEELQLSCDIFCNNIIPVAKTKWDKERKEIEKRFANYAKRTSIFTQYLIDPANCKIPKHFVTPEEYELDFLITEWQMKAYSYQRIMGMGISNIVMIWEQQLFDYMKHFDNDTSNHYAKLSESCLRYTDFDLKNDGKIKEIRHVVNAIKHGKDTNSFKWLENHDSKFLEENISTMFLEVEERYFFISVSKRDIKSITNYLILFWKKLQSNRDAL